MVLLPHGGFPLFIVTVSMMAWISFLSQDGCDYVRLSGPAVSNFTSGPYPFVEIGFRGYRVPTEVYGEEWQISYSRCISYDSSSFDGYWSVGKICHAAAAVFGGAGSLFFCFISIGLVMTQRHWRLSAIPFILATGFQLLSFAWFENELCKDGNNCVLFYGSMSAIVSLLLYFTSAVSILYYPEPKISKYLKRSYGSDLYNNFDTRNSVMTDPRIEKVNSVVAGRSREGTHATAQSSVSSHIPTSLSKDNKHGTIYI